jgi:hypothetical protein
MDMRVVIVFTQPEAYHRVISFRKATTDERKHYEQAYKTNLERFDALSDDMIDTSKFRRPTSFYNGTIKDAEIAGQGHGGSRAGGHRMVQSAGRKLPARFAAALRLYAGPSGNQVIEVSDYPAKPARSHAVVKTSQVFIFRKARPDHPSF